MSEYSEQMEAVKSIQNQCMWMIWTGQWLISTAYINAVSIACSMPNSNAKLI